MRDTRARRARSRSRSPPPPQKGTDFGTPLEEGKETLRSNRFGRDTTSASRNARRGEKGRGGDAPDGGSWKREREGDAFSRFGGRGGGFRSGTTGGQQHKRAKRSVFHAKEQEKSSTFRNPDSADGEYSDQEVYERAIDHLDYRRLKRYKSWTIEDPEYHRQLYQSVVNMGSPVRWSETDEDERIENILNPKEKSTRKVAGPTLPKAFEGEDDDGDGKSRRKKKKKKKKEKSSKDKKKKKKKSRTSSSRRKRAGGRNDSESSSGSSSREDDDIDEGELIPDFDDAGGKNDDKDQAERFLRFIEREEQKKREMLVAEERKKKEESLRRTGDDGAGVPVAVDFGPSAPPPEDGDNLNVTAGIRKPGYGGQLLPGEGSAMAQFVQSGQRIPRRGEVGYSSEQIENFEKMGYVMSGSRHARMNAVRLRKENQVYSAEEQAALAMINYEEKAAKEKEVMEELKRLVNQAKKD